MSRRPARVRALLLWLLGIAVVCGLLAGAGLWIVNSFKPAPPPLATGCTAAVADAKYTLAPDQAANAALITAIAVRRGLPARAASIALSVAIQESKLRNIPNGDLDSLGLFQQRPSQGWGTQAQVQDPVYATNAFFDVLTQVKGYESLPITDAAQRVQRSAYPDAYAQREPQGRAFASALTGASPESLVCTLESPTAAGSPAAVLAELERGYGTVATSADGNTLRIPAGPAAGWGYAQWAVANADALNITEVSFAGKHWVRSNNAGTTNAGWTPETGDAAGADAGTVIITVHPAKP
ncbi:MAG: hypothetical protein ACHP7K_07475 [Actinomycetales bacterium]